MAKKHRAIEVGEAHMISLCETCKHMPEGKVPQSNFEVDNGRPEQPHMFCVKKAFFPSVNYDNSGKPFYDVAKCDGYDRYEQKKSETHKTPDIKRAEG